MKTNLLMMAFASLVIAGCNVKSSDDVKKETDEIIKKSQQDMDELTNSLYRGGQPGKVTVKGIIVKKDGDKMLLDERIKIEQIGGKGNRGVSQTMVSEKNKAVLSETSDVKVLSSASESKKYINLGCENLTAEETEGLEQDSDKALTDSVLSLSAKKIFVCGSPQISQSFVSLSADQLVLKNASLKVKAMVGSLNVSASKIELNGSNSIETNGIEATISVMDAPSLDLLVASEISGEGTLKVASIGGNCVQKDEKK
ncbi:MAG: hypothetical protein AAGB31_12270 [Bdellovibrio sp.]